MNIDLNEKNLIYLLNSLNYTLHKLKYHTINDRKDLELYFNFCNYAEDYNNLTLIHRWLSTKGNKCFYNISNDIFFCGQKLYLTNSKKDFKFLYKKKFSKIENFSKNDIDIISKIV